MSETKDASHPWAQLLETRRGQRVTGAVEYVLLTVCVAVVISLGASALGDGLRSALASVGNYLQATASTI